jgi:hypothetical protein
MTITMTAVCLADIIALIHLGYIMFVILGFALIVAGVIFRWQWIRNPWFRILHLAAIVAVAMEAILGLHCPLTVLEFRLRYSTRAVQEKTSFIGNFIDSILFYEAPGWLFTAVYAAFAMLVLITFIMAPPKRKSVQVKKRY